MIQRVRYLLSNPLELLAYAVEHPRRVLAAVAVVVVVVVGAVLSFGLNLVPEWTMLFAIAGVAGYLARRRYHRAKLFLQASATDSGDISQGLVRVGGAAQPADGAGSVQFEGTEYLVYHNKVERKRSNRNEGGSQWRVEKDTTEAVPLEVDDGTGSVLVDSHSATLRLDWDKKQRDGRRRHYFAGLKPGDTVRVYGTAVPESQRQPQRVSDAATEGMESLRENNVGQMTDGDGLVVTTGTAVPELVVTDRSHWGLVGRSVLLSLATAAVAVGLVALGIYYALGGSLV
jgi:hypothetical protein